METIGPDSVKVILETFRNISVVNIYFKIDEEFGKMCLQIRNNELTLILERATPPEPPLATPPQPPLATPPELPLATPPELPLATSPELPLATPPELPLATPPELPLATPPNYKLKLIFTEKFFIPASFYSHGGHLLKLRKSDKMVEAEYQMVDAEYDMKLGLPVCRLDIDPSHQFAQDIQNLSINNIPNHQLQTDTPYFIFCSSCSETISDGPATFKELSNLPFDFSELSESFFCHQHSAAITKTVSQPTNVLFLTPTCYVLSCLHKDFLNKDSLLGVIQCKNCSSIFCYTNWKNLDRFRDSVFCFKDKIAIITSKKFIFSEDCDKVNTSLNCLLSIIQDTFKTSTMCKLYLEAKMPMHENNCLLIWVINPEIKVFTSKSEASQDDSSTGEIVEFTSLVKVLYRSTQSIKDFARSWVHDFSVDFHHISDTMLVHIRDYLFASSRNMPESKEYPDKFSVGYIPLQLQ